MPEFSNIEMEVKGSKLTLVIDLNQESGPSASGKSITIASTKGNHEIENTGVYLGVNVYKKK